MVKIKFPAALAVLGLVIALAIFTAKVGAFGNTVVAPNARPNVLEHITFASTFTDADARYLQTSLEWLREYLPEWYTYVADAKPLLFAQDETQRARGIISYAKCCYTRGTGAITFSAPLGQWNLDEMPAVPGVQAQQVQFLSVLIHEVTHIRDVRAGRFEHARDARTCIAAEQSANDSELAFARALTRVQITGDANARANYRLIADKHLEITQDNAEGVAWKIVCFLMHDE
jgi:hypothetical protein